MPSARRTAMPKHSEIVWHDSPGISPLLQNAALWATFDMERAYALCVLGTEAASRFVLASTRPAFRPFLLELIFRSKKAKTDGVLWRKRYFSARALRMP